VTTRTRRFVPLGFILSAVLIACSSASSDSEGAGGSAGGALGVGGTTSSGGAGGTAGIGGTASSGGLSSGGAGSGGDASGGVGAGEATGGVGTGGAPTGGAATGGTGGEGDGGTGTGSTAGTGTGGGASTGPYTWKTVTLGGGGFVSAVIASLAEQNLFFARTDVGGLFRWNEGTSSWVALTDWVSEDQTGYLGVDSVALDPEDAGRVYALVGIDYFNGGKTAILRSTDKGNTFTVTEVTSQFKTHGNGMGRQNGERLAVDPNLSSTLLCGSRRNGLFKSTDYGASWSAVSSFPVTTTSNDNGISFVMFDKASSSVGSATQRIFVGVSRLGAANVYMSNNGGSTWAEVPNAPATTQMPQRAALASSGMLYVTYANGAGPTGNGGTEPMNAGSIWKYDTVGGGWTNITPAGVTPPFSGISVDASDANHLVATTINTYWQQPWGWGDHIYVSTNGGSSWTDIVGADKPTMDVNGMPWIEGHAIHWAGTATFDPNNSNRVFVTSGNGIFATSNLNASTSTWKFMSKGLEETVPLEAVSLPGKGFATVIGDYDGFVTTNLDVSPAGVHAPSMGTTGALALAGATPSTMVRLGSSMYKTTDYGTSWTQVPLTGGGSRGTVALSANGSVILWTPESSTTTYRTANDGSMWTTVTGLSINAPVIGDSVNSNKFYAYNPNGGAFYLSTDGGSSFSQVSTPGGGGAWKLRAVPGVEGDIWIALRGNGLTRSTDSGSTFTTLTGVQRADAVGFGKADAGKTFPTVFIWGVADNGPVGIYRSTDAGATWLRINDDQHQYGGPGNGQFIVGDMNVFGRVYMSTAGRGTVYGEP
jgi:hypothetical protein